MRLLEDAKIHGFRIYLHYLWLSSPAIAIARVRERVRKGGLNVPVADIGRRFARSIQHFGDDYAPIADRWAVWNNQNIPPVLLAESGSCTVEDLRVLLGQL